MIRALFAATLAGAPAPAADLATLSRSVEALCARVAPSVVPVFVTGLGPLVEDGGSDQPLGLLRGGGSGVIVDPDGWIVTNTHVVEGALRLSVALEPAAADAPAGRSILKPRGERVTARIVGIDRETDVAVLRVERGGLPALPFADSDGVRQGQIVFAFGSPHGLENSVTMGVVSFTARQVEPDDPMVYIQTDAPINPGNSGGPLVDVAGRIIGLNTFIVSESGGSEGLGFAVPSNIVSAVYQQIRRHGRVRRGEIGAETQTVTPALARGLGLARTWGVVVADVLPGGPASAAGLQVGDLILALDGKPMENARQLDINLYRRAEDETARLSLLRRGRTVEVPVRVVDRPEDPPRVGDLLEPGRALVAELGVFAADLAGDLAERMAGTLRVGSGVVVLGRAQPASSSEEDLLPGDVVHAVNGRAVESLEALRSALAGVPPDEPCVLQIERDGRFRYVAAERN